MRTVRTICFPLALLALASVGCSDPADLGPTGTIQGMLTFKGQPLSPGTQVVFMHQTRGFAGLGATDEKGHFEITLFRKSGETPELPVGTYNVMVQPPSGSDSSELADPSAGLTPDEMAAKNRQLRFQKTEFPMKYRQASTSGLTREVKKGPNTFEIDLQPSS